YAIRNTQYAIRNTQYAIRNTHDENKTDNQMATLQEKLIDILINNKLVTRPQIDQALKAQKEMGVGIKRILVDGGLVKEKDLLSLLARELYIPPLDLSRYKINEQVVSLIPERVARQYHLIAISRIGNILTVAMSDPLNIFALDDLKALTSYEVQPVISLDADIEQAIGKYYKSDKETILGILKDSSGLEDVVDKDKDDKWTIDISGALADSKKAPIVKIVDMMLAQAMKKRASDIHIEPEEDCLRVRYRIDGQLHDIFNLPRVNQNAILARLKIISGLNITESRLPQDGRFKIRMEGKEVDFRVSALPTIFGQKFVLRLLNKSSISVGLDSLGFNPHPLSLFRQAISRPYGMILVTGPTGSGKSTTLYSVLNQLNTPQRNITTIEDPVEYQVDGITQVQANPDIGLTFAAGLRSLLRQSPDIIMIGEIRDFDTADIAVKASLTGQMVLSTLHTNDAVGAISRLIDMGVEPFLVASSLIMACAQRLVRSICPRCKQVVTARKDVLCRLKINIPEDTVFYSGKGCDYCSHTGYFGRVGILEALVVDDALRDMVINRASLDKIKDYAVSHCGMETLREDAGIKLLQGVTTIEEVIRVTNDE
ncbi:MAG: GspE/PulE family protein, partial [Candidatus Omnitrophota bacterium]